MIHLLLIGLGGLSIYIGKKIFIDWSLNGLNKHKSKLSKNEIKLKSKFNIMRKIVLSEDNNEQNILLIGQPGAGKSSLIINLTDRKCIPIPEIGSVTDSTNWVTGDISNSIIKYKSYMFIDTPGYDTSMHPVRIYIDYFPFDIFDKILFVANSKFHKSDSLMVKKLTRKRNKVFYIRTFMDSYSINDVYTIKKDLMRLGCVKEEIHVVSNKNMNGIDKLKEAIGL